MKKNLPFPFQTVSFSAKKLALLSWLIVGIFLIPSCGYRLTGTGNQLPPHIKTLAIPVFENETNQPELHRNLTDAVRQAFLNDGRVKIVQKKSSDLLVQGTLDYYDVRAVAFDSNDVATQYWVKIGVKIKAYDRVKDRPYLKDNLRTRWDYTVDANVASSEDARLRALDDAYRDISLRLVSLFLDPF